MTAAARDGRRRTTDLVTVTARPRWAVQLASWAAGTCWAVAAYLGCVGVLYGVIGQQAAGGGPPLWPAAARHGWLVTHLAALRAGHVTLRELP